MTVFCLSLTLSGCLSLVAVQLLLSKLKEELMATKGKVAFYFLDEAVHIPKKNNEIKFPM